MKKELRSSGIDIIGNVPWGTHFCQFYQTKKDLMDVQVPYFKAGLENNEFCIWIVSQPSEVKEVKEILRKDLPDFDVYLEKGQIEVVPSTHWFVREGIFDSEKVLNCWIEKLNKALTNGYDGLRLSGDTFWLEKKDWSSFDDYEKELDRIIGNYRLIAICTYSLDRCNATEIIDVISKHQFALIKRNGKWEHIENSRRVKTEDKIQTLANIVETSDDAIVTESLDGVIISWNKGAEQIYGYSAKEILGKPISILEPPMLVEETKELNELIKQDDKIHHYETLRSRKDGKIINVSLTVSPIFDASEDLIAILVIARDITGRKRADEKLKKSEERYRIVTEQTGQVIYDYDIRSDKCSWAGAIEEVTGYSSEEFQKLGKDVWIKNIKPLNTNSAEEKSWDVRREENRFKEELTFRRKDGNRIYIENRGVCLTNSEGHLYGAIGVLKDITGARLAKTQLQESEKRYRIATERTGQVVFDFNLKTFELRLAGAVREVTGYNPEELGNPDKSVLIEYVHPEDRTELLDTLRKSFEEKKKFQVENKFQVEFRLKKRDENYIYAESRGIWLTDGSGEIHRAIGVIKDITDRILSIKKVEDSEKKYRSFIQNFHGIIYQADENFVPVFLHGAVKEITGYKAEEFKSRIKWEDLIYPDDLPLVLNEGRKIKSSQSADYGELEYRIKHRDGRIRWVNEIYQKISGNDENPGFYQSTIYDVTERKEAENFVASIETARKKEIHHRIKNNLQVISSLLDLQAEKFRDKEVLEAFRESQDRIISMSLIHEELYKGGGTDTLNFSEYIKKLTENLFLTYSLKSKNICLLMDLEENALFNMDTAVPLGIIVNELVSNSLKYAFPDQQEGEIRICLCREEKNDEVRRSLFSLVISDNGKGMPENMELESVESLGLQLVNILVDQLDGEIKLNRDRGTEFRITFEVVEEA
ncbi:sensory transduction histidine kinase [Methanosarcina siciliae T4/M]|uniref:Sensory transduction histidine kinase n=1 Tax=Methanosarcina siciliae T4/M TaxID=1434120 RepID=A0A0E3P2K4_9EURY|nr:PAS domain S-box protein [Methanosarcina siciliae]AKB27593.1 sensory transduction histidine kinase [Methanosarcina siciliae T4/M]